MRRNKFGAKKPATKILLIILPVVISFVVIVLLRWPQVGEKPGVPTPPEAGYELVVKVIDGDTLKLAGGERVRLIGVDTPETKHPRKAMQCFGEEAYRFTRGMAEGKKVKLEYDWQPRDRYGRLLGYVYLPDGTFLNAEILKQGFAFAYTRYPFKYLEEFRQYEREARDEGRGLWGECE